MSPSWRSAIVIDYSMRDTDDYVAELFHVEQGQESQSVLLADVSFKLAELVTSKGEYIFKPLNCRGVIMPMDDNENDF